MARLWFNLKPVGLAYRPTLLFARRDCLRLERGIFCLRLAPGIREDNRNNYFSSSRAFIFHTTAMVKRGFSLERCR